MGICGLDIPDVKGRCRSPSAFFFLFRERWKGWRL